MDLFTELAVLTFRRSRRPADEALASADGDLWSASFHQP